MWLCISVAWIADFLGVESTKDNCSKYNRGRIYGVNRGSKRSNIFKSLTATIFRAKMAYKLVGDNKASLDLAKTVVFHARTKHIELKHRFITEVIESGIIQVERVASKDELSDGFTKPFFLSLHLRLLHNHSRPSFACFNI